MKFHLTALLFTLALAKTASAEGQASQQGNTLRALKKKGRDPIVGLTFKISPDLCRNLPEENKAGIQCDGEVAFVPEELSVGTVSSWDCADKEFVAVTCGTNIGMLSCEKGKTITFSQQDGYKVFGFNYDPKLAYKGVESHGEWIEVYNNKNASPLKATQCMAEGDPVKFYPIQKFQLEGPGIRVKVTGVTEADKELDLFDRKVFVGDEVEVEPSQEAVARLIVKIGPSDTEADPTSPFDAAGTQVITIPIDKCEKKDPKIKDIDAGVKFGSLEIIDTSCEPV